MCACTSTQEDLNTQEYIQPSTKHCLYHVPVPHSWSTFYLLDQLPCQYSCFLPFFLSFVPSEYQSCQSAHAPSTSFCQDAPLVLEQQQASYAGLAFPIICTPLYGVVISLRLFSRCDVVQRAVWMLWQIAGLRSGCRLREIVHTHASMLRKT